VGKMGRAGRLEKAPMDKILSRYKTYRLERPTYAFTSAKMPIGYISVRLSVKRHKVATGLHFCASTAERHNRRSLPGRRKQAYVGRSRR